MWNRLLWSNNPSKVLDWKTKLFLLMWRDCEQLWAQNTRILFGSKKKTSQEHLIFLQSLDTIYKEAGTFLISLEDLFLRLSFPISGDGFSTKVTKVEHWNLKVATQHFFTKRCIFWHFFRVHFLEKTNIFFHLQHWQEKTKNWQVKKRVWICAFKSLQKRHISQNSIWQPCRCKTGNALLQFFPSSLPNDWNVLISEHLLLLQFQIWRFKDKHEREKGSTFFPSRLSRGNKDVG